MRPDIAWLLALGDRRFNAATSPAGYGNRCSGHHGGTTVTRRR
jgi:hypothetical protein